MWTLKGVNIVSFCLLSFLVYSIVALEVEKDHEDSLEDLEDMITSESRAARFLRLKWPNFTKKKARVNKIKKRLGPLGYIPPPPIVHKKKKKTSIIAKSLGHHSALKSPVNSKKTFTSYYQKSPAVISTTSTSKNYQPSPASSKQYYKNLKKRLHLKPKK